MRATGVPLAEKIHLVPLVFKAKSIWYRGRTGRTGGLTGTVLKAFNGLVTEKKAVLKGECGPLADHWRTTGGSLAAHCGCFQGEIHLVPAGSLGSLNCFEGFLRTCNGKKTCFEGRMRTPGVPLRAPGVPLACHWRLF